MMVKYEDSVLITAIMESKIIFSILSIKLLLLGTSGIGASAFTDDLILIDTTALLVAGAYTSASWMIPILVSAVGIGLAVFTLKRSR